MTKYLCPVYDGGITKKYTGPKTGTKETEKNHWGVDYGWVNRSEINTELLAIADGFVVDVIDKTEEHNDGFSSCGYSIVYQVNDDEEGKHRFATYIHMQKPSPFNIGDKVKQGDVLGYRGNTGQSRGPHLHFGLTAPTGKAYSWYNVKALAINPQPLLCKSSKYNYAGVMFDSMPMLDDDTEVEQLREQVAKLTEDLNKTSRIIQQIKNILNEE